MRAWIMAGIVLVGAAWVAPAAGQLCLGRTLPGELSIATDVAVLGWESMGGRVSVGDELANGLGWRAGLVGARGEVDGWEAHAGQVELFWSTQVADRVHVCPGVSGFRTFDWIDDSTTLIDVFTSVGFETPFGDGATLVPFLTPHLVVAFVQELAITEADWSFSSYDPGVYDETRTTVMELTGGLTGGVGLLMGPLSVRAMLTAIIGPGPGVHPAVGMGVGWRPSWASRR